MMYSSASQRVDLLVEKMKRLPLQRDVPVRCTVSTKVWSELGNLPATINRPERRAAHLTIIGLPIQVDHDMSEWQYEIEYADGHTERHDLRRRTSGLVAELADRQGVVT